MRDLFDGSYNPAPKRTITFATGPGELVIILSLILLPKIGMISLHLFDREPVQHAAIDFREACLNSQGSKELFRSSLRRFAGPPEVTGV